MSILFEQTEIRGMRLSNRFVRSATWEAMAGQDGSVTPALVRLMRDLAEGDVGLIISSHAYVRPEGQAGPKQLGVYQDELIPGLREMAEAVHRHGGKIALQLAHAGLFANPKLTGRMPLAPSMASGVENVSVQEMTLQDIEEVIEAFGEGARRAKEAGFDAVQIHAAHGYLLSQFLSPFFNRRTDAYGGPVRNRVRIVQEVIRCIRSVVGEDFPVLIKMNCKDFLDRGLSLQESVEAARILQEEGLCAVEISGGCLLSGPNIPSRVGISSKEKEAYFREAGRAFKEALKIPVILVGGLRSFEVAEGLVTRGEADFISMSRPLIREPHLIRRWREGDRRPAACLSDNQCFGPVRAGESLHCVVERKLREKKGKGEN